MKIPKGKKTASRRTSNKLNATKKKLQALNGYAY